MYWLTYLKKNLIIILSVACYLIFTFSHLADAFIQSDKWGQQKQSIVVLKQLKTL